MSSEFNTTCWTLILQAAESSSEGSRLALESLCRRYWLPIYGYVRDSGFNHQDAEDMTQSFFAHLLERNLPGRANPEIGRFRSYLIVSLRNFIRSSIRTAHTKKRDSGTGPLISFDELEEEMRESLITTPSAEADYDRKWAHRVLEIALDQLGAEQARLGHGERFAILRPLLLDPNGSAAAQDQLSGISDLEKGNVRIIISRLRARFRQLVREEVARIVASPLEVDAEIAHLLQALK